MYSLYKITPISDLPKKDIKAINMAIEVAEKSQFDSTKRLGACLRKGQCFVCG
jgi:hypothetical protein